MCFGSKNMINGTQHGTDILITTPDSIYDIICLIRLLKIIFKIVSCGNFNYKFTQKLGWISKLDRKIEFILYMDIFISDFVLRHKVKESFDNNSSHVDIFIDHESHELGIWNIIRMTSVCVSTSKAEVSNILVFLCHIGRRRVVLGRT